MKNLIKNKNFLSLVLLLFFLLLLKIDYRFIEQWNCCQDDHDYFMHAETIALDFDLDYSNQLKGNEEKRFNNNGKIAPKAFIGTGLLSAPFLFVGNLFNYFSSNSLMNFGLLFYSLSSVVYLFLTIIMIYKLLNSVYSNIDFKFIFLLIFGSGIPYFAFERYSMSHIFEIFTIMLTIYFSHMFYKSNEKNNFYAFFIPIAILLAILVRWVNYYAFILPYITFLLFKKAYKKDLLLRNNKYFFGGALLSVLIFSYLSKTMYGVITFNPQFVYGTSGMLDGYLDTSEGVQYFLLNNFKHFINIMFTKEFGIFWFSPIIFIALVLVIYNFLFKKENKILYLLLSISFAQIFTIVLIWKSTASSYGFRYLFNLVPLSILIFYHYAKNKNIQFINYYLYVFSIIGILSLFFFETTEMTQLSIVNEVNSFGRELRFTEPNYLIGFINSFTFFDSYLKIFTTSFLGAIFFKLLISAFGVSSLISFLTGLGLPVENQDFIDYLDKLNQIEYSKFIFIILFFIYFSIKFVKYAQNET
tara:strand:- start:693 stop:2276 length:1584 start_codon:yes stop_codon:yes gene_type:complete